MSSRTSIPTPAGDVSAIAQGVSPRRPLFVFAHGAGAPMEHPFMNGAADAIAQAGVGCLRFNFAYVERGRKSPDTPKVLEEVWRAVFEHGLTLASRVWVGGRSMGGRIASMLVAEGMHASGLIFFSYPLHAVGKTEKLRDAHLSKIDVPMLFLQGTRDAMARWDLLESVVAKLGRAELYPVEGGDHSLKAKRSDDATEVGSRLGGIASEFILSKH